MSITKHLLKSTHALNYFIPYNIIFMYLNKEKDHLLRLMILNLLLPIYMIYLTCFLIQQAPLCKIHFFKKRVIMLGQHVGALKYDTFTVMCKIVLNFVYIGCFSYLLYTKGIIR